MSFFIAKDLVIHFWQAFLPCHSVYKLFPLASKDTLYSWNPGQTGSYTKLDFDFKCPLMVELTAHPLFVLHFTHNVMFGKVSVANRNLQGEDYSWIFRITSSWEKEAPADFHGVVSPDFWREHCHPCSDNGSSPSGGISVGNKCQRPSPADAQRDCKLRRRKKPKPRGHKSEAHKPEAHGTSDGKHLVHSRTYNLVSTDRGSHQLSAQNLRLFQLQMDHKKPSEPRHHRSQSPPSLISDHSSLSSVQQRSRRHKSVSLPRIPLVAGFREWQTHSRWLWQAETKAFSASSDIAPAHSNSIAIPANEKDNSANIDDSYGGSRTPERCRSNRSASPRRGSDRGQLIFAFNFVSNLSQSQ